MTTTPSTRRRWFGFRSASFSSVVLEPVTGDRSSRATSAASLPMGTSNMKEEMSLEKGNISFFLSVSLHKKQIQMQTGHGYYLFHSGGSSTLWVLHLSRLDGTAPAVATLSSASAGSSPLDPRTSAGPPSVALLQQHQRHQQQPKKQVQQ